MGVFVEGSVLRPVGPARVPAKVRGPEYHCVTLVLVLFLGCTDVGIVAEVTEVHAASVFRFQVFAYI
jgi:hypothetical protein